MTVKEFASVCENNQDLFIMMMDLYNDFIRCTADTVPVSLNNRIVEKVYSKRNGKYTEIALVTVKE